MKIFGQEFSGDGKDRFVMHISRDELRLIHGTVQASFEHMPRVAETERTRGKMRALLHSIGQAMNEQNPTQDHFDSAAKAVKYGINRFYALTAQKSVRTASPEEAAKIWETAVKLCDDVGTRRMAAWERFCMAKEDAGDPITKLVLKA